MKLHKLLSNLLLALLLALVSTNLFAETKWEVATLFFGQNEDQEFQASVDQNLKELATIAPSNNLKISTYRESPFQNNQRSRLLSFLRSSFKDSQSKKMLVFYGHGIGPRGLRDFPVLEIKALLSQLGIKVDIIWFDACFLSNLEFLYELKDQSTFSIASEEAEFDSGLPFEALSELPLTDSALDASALLAKRFIESYSYLKHGAQVGSVYTSSATISVIDNSELENFVVAFKRIPQILKSLPVSDQEALRNKLEKKFSMDQKELVDLGHLLIELRSLVKDSAANAEVTKLIRLLNIESVKKLQTNPRVRISPPEPQAQMMFGFNNWENGSKNEYVNNPLFKQILDTKNFMVGYDKLEWPVKKFQTAGIIVSPFAPGINSFDYLFINAAGTDVIGEVVSVTRTHDIVETSLSRKSPGSFLLYTAYTQRLGVMAERYTGVNITLFNTIPSLDYYESSFNQMIGWLKL